MLEAEFAAAAAGGPPGAVAAGRVSPAGSAEGDRTDADGAGIDATVCRSACSSWVIVDSRTLVSSAFSRSTRTLSVMPLASSF